MNNIINLEGIEKEYSFLMEGVSEDRYFCSCGHQFSIENNSEVSELSELLSEDSEEDVFEGVYSDIKMSFGDVKCSSCGQDFNEPNNRRKLISLNKVFISGYEYEETESSLLIFYSKISPGAESRTLQDDTKEYRIVFDENVRYIRFEKESKNLFFKDFNDSKEIEFDLDKVIFYVEKFFDVNTDKIVNLFKLHMYINRLANFVSDTKNTKIVSDFLDFVRNRPNESGIDYIQKLLSIFFGIIKYSNLSTIALTKNSQFLYDLMLECDIPSSEEMSNSGATSPVKIFNFLINKYINKLNQEVNEDNKEAHSFTFKSKQRIEYEKAINEEEEKLKYSIKKDESETDYIVRENKDYKGGKVVQTEEGFKVMDAVLDGSISKFIFNTIDSFSDYKQIIKYFKFYNKKELIAILQKYDIRLLTGIIDFIYFRDRMDFKELDRVLSIVDDYLESNYLFKDYSNIRNFSFVEYDDAKMMMEIMEFDPRKHFNKIKTYNELTEYHDNLITFYKVKTDEGKTGEIKEFADSLRYLETKGEGDYEGPLDVKILDDPGLIIKEGVEMMHSASAYAPKVAQKSYLLASLFDRDPNRPDDELERFTIGFTYNKYNGLEFDQVKGKTNILGSDRFKKLVMQFLVSKDISYKPVKDLKLSSING